ncbi:MAG: RluA family pseudouridine synthase [Chitinispirillaceae bacterium]|nr:RluA family pseudouridine synthase [Chitinispirillaceae bacterium]
MRFSRPTTENQSAAFTIFIDMIQITIGPPDAGSRLDRVLRRRLPLMSLSSIFSLIRKGGVRVGGRKTKQDYRVVEGDQIDIHADEAEVMSPAGPDKSLRAIVATTFFKKNFIVIYEDQHILACNKPSGLVVHPGTGHLKHDTLIDLATGYLIEQGALSEGEEPALVHRLDRDTSGVILIAKTKQIIRQLNEIFRSRLIEKRYIAITHNSPPAFEGEIVLSMSRAHEYDNGTKMRVGEDGQLTKSRYRILERHGNCSRLEVFLETGKTHQIRVHLSHIGAPIIGDSRYGNEDLDNTLFKRTSAKCRLYLHAERISFIHPAKNKKIVLTAPVPREFDQMMSGI